MIFFNFFYLYIKEHLMINKIIHNLKAKYPEMEHIDFQLLIDNPNNLINLEVKDIKLIKNEIAPNWISQIKNDDMIEFKHTQEIQQISNLMIRFIQMGNEIEEAISIFKNKIKRQIFESNTKYSFSIITDEEFNDIANVFLDENQKFHGYIEILTNPRVPNLLCKEFSQVQLKNKLLTI